MKKYVNTLSVVSLLATSALFLTTACDDKRAFQPIQPKNLADAQNCLVTNTCDLEEQRRQKLGDPEAVASAKEKLISVLKRQGVEDRHLDMDETDGKVIQALSVSLIKKSDSELVTQISALLKLDDSENLAYVNLEFNTKGRISGYNFVAGVEGAVFDPNLATLKMIRDAAPTSDSSDSIVKSTLDGVVTGDLPLQITSAVSQDLKEALVHIQVNIENADGEVESSAALLDLALSANSYTGESSVKSNTLAGKAKPVAELEDQLNAIYKAAEEKRKAESKDEAIKDAQSGLDSAKSLEAEAASNLEELRKQVKPLEKQIGELQEVIDDAAKDQGERDQAGTDKALAETELLKLIDVLIPEAERTLEEAKANVIDAQRVLDKLTKEEQA